MLGHFRQKTRTKRMAKIQAFYSKNAVLGAPGGGNENYFPRFGRFGPERVRKSTIKQHKNVTRDFYSGPPVAVL